MEPRRFDPLPHPPTGLEIISIPMLLKLDSARGESPRKGEWNWTIPIEMKNGKISDEDLNTRQEIFSKIFRTDSDRDAAKLRFPDRSYQQFDHFIKGMQGNPLLLSGAFERMIYFSAVVITTVGFGDIVPMTSAARGVVAFEAIFGIVLAGLFLNSVAYQASRRSRD